MSARIKLGVVYGGRSSEHEVSVVSAQAVLREADAARFEAVPFGVTGEGHWLTPQESQMQLNQSIAPFQNRMSGDVPPLLHRPEVLDELRGMDVVFPLVHGVNGEDGTLQGLLTPTLQYSWDAPEYYAFFVQHGGVPVAAVTLAFGTALKPHPGAFGRVVFWSWMYLAVVYGLNRLLGANYGFLNAKPPVPSLLDYMGPYPWYLLTLQFVAFALYLLLLMPFRRRNIARGD